MRSFAVISLAALALIAPAVAMRTRTPAQLWPVVKSSVAGYELRYPPGWHAARGTDGTLFVSSRPITSTELDRPGRPRAPGTALLWVIDYGQAHRPLPALPRPLRLPPPVSMEGFGLGSSLSFGLHGHQFQVFAAFGAGASPRTRALALRTIETLATTASPLPNTSRVFKLGRSVEQRQIRAYRLGDPDSRRKILVVGCIHGDECAGMAATLALLNDPLGIRADVWVVQNLNPDGFAAGHRQNAHGVDLNRNFSSGWQQIGSPGSPQYSGPHPFSEPETRIARELIDRIHPEITIWFHQHADMVRAWGASIPAARRYAKLVGLPFRRLHWLAGTAPNWQNHAFPGAASFVVELPPGPLTPTAARRYARAIVTLSG